MKDIVAKTRHRANGRCSAWTTAGLPKTLFKHNNKPVAHGRTLWDIMQTHTASERSYLGAYPVSLAGRMRYAVPLGPSGRIVDDGR